MERRLAVVAGMAIVVAGALLHFVYGWSGRNALVGLVSPLNESVWEHTKLLVMPLVLAGVVEAILLRDVRRVAWAVLVESVLGSVAIIAVFYTYTGALGTGPILWVDIMTFVLIVAAGQWVHLRVLAARWFPPRAVSVLGVVAVIALYAVLTKAPPDLPVFRADSGVLAGPGPSPSNVLQACCGAHPVPTWCSSPTRAWSRCNGSLPPGRSLCTKTVRISISRVARQEIPAGAAFTLARCPVGGPGPAAHRRTWPGIAGRRGG